MKLTFEERSAFGRVLYYPLSLEAHAICEVSKVKSLIRWQLEVLKEAGFKLEVLSKPPEFE